MTVIKDNQDNDCVTIRQASEELCIDVEATKQLIANDTLELVNDRYVTCESIDNYLRS